MQLEDLGTPLKLGTEGFVRELQNVPIINVDIPYTFHHFVTPRITNQKPERKRISFIDLLVKGNVDENSGLQFFEMRGGGLLLILFSEIN